MKIRLAEKKDIENLAYLQEKVFPGFFMASLGHGFLKTFYKVAISYPETTCLVAEDEEGAFLGYVFGRTRAKGYLKNVLKRGLLLFGIEGIKLLFTRPSAIIRLAKNLDKKDSSGMNSDDKDYAEIGLIGVIPDKKGMGIGHTLFYAFEQEVKQKGAKRISLTTDCNNNDNTLTAYKAWGFRVLYEFVTYPDRRMYRLIKDIEQ